MVQSSAKASRLVNRIQAALKPFANRARSDFMAGGYAPSGLRCLGVAVPEMRAVVRAFARDLKDRPPREIIALALALARQKTIEGRQVGYELIARRADAMALLTPGLVRTLGRGNDNWASVDGFATYLTGPAWRLGRVSDQDVLGWATSSDTWWRRTALVSTVALNVGARGGTGDSPRTLLICERFARETDPMLVKALSWALRSLVPRDPDGVRNFLARHKTLAGIVRREVTAKLETGTKVRR